MTTHAAKNLRVFINGVDVSTNVHNFEFTAAVHAACEVRLALYAVPVIVPSVEPGVHHDIHLTLGPDSRPSLPTADTPRAISLRGEVETA